MVVYLFRFIFVKISKTVKEVTWIFFPDASIAAVTTKQLKAWTDVSLEKLIKVSRSKFYTFNRFLPYFYVSHCSKV